MATSQTLLRKTTTVYIPLTPTNGNKKHPEIRVHNHDGEIVVALHQDDEEKDASHEASIDENGRQTLAALFEGDHIQV